MIEENLQIVEQNFVQSSSKSSLHPEDGSRKLL
jgi:hypothetical protein